MTSQELTQRLIDDLAMIEEVEKYSNSSGSVSELANLQMRDLKAFTAMAWISTSFITIKGTLGQLQQILGTKKELIAFRDAKGIAEIVRQSSSLESKIERAISEIMRGALTPIGYSGSVGEMLEEVLDNVHADAVSIFETYRNLNPK